MSYQISNDAIINAMNNKQIEIWNVILKQYKQSNIPNEIKTVINLLYPKMYDTLFDKSSLLLQKIYYDYFKENPGKLFSIPIKYISDNMLKEAIDIDPNNFINFPHKYKLQLYDYALEKCNFVLLKHIQVKYRTQELCKKTMLKNGMSLLYLPKIYHMQTNLYIYNDFAKEIYKDAIENNGLALQYIPKILFSKAINDINHLFKLAVESNGASIKYIPVQNRTYELCKISSLSFIEAVKHFPPNLEYMHTQTEMEELYKICVTSNPLSLEYINSKFKTTNLCLLGIDIDGAALKYVPYKLKTQDMCRRALQSNIRAIEHIPRYILCISMYERIYKKDPIYAKTIMFLFSDLCNESHIEFDNKNICSICLEDGNKKSIFKLITDPCKTYYCIDCFNTWIKENTTCPGCRNFLMITKGSKYKINKISCKIEKYINNKYENNNNYGRGDRYYYNRNYFY